MSKKTQIIVQSIVTGLSGVAVGIVSAVSPEYMVPINSSIAIVAGAVNEIISLFVKP